MLGISPEKRHHREIPNIFVDNQPGQTIIIRNPLIIRTQDQPQFNVTDEAFHLINFITLHPQKNLDLW